MFITPNIRALAKAAKLADFVYPNPYEANPQTGEITTADDETWSMAQELIKSSDNPNRKLDKEGLVLHNSYASMPWLIYENDQVPWHRDEVINKFAKKYLGYSRKEDKEFVVRARIGIGSLVRYYFRVLKKRKIIMIDNAYIEEKTKGQFDKWAHTYDGGVWSLYFKKAIEYALNIVELKENSVILDLGCGTGELGLMTVQKNKGNQVVGIDLSSEMIKNANEKQLQKNISSEKLKYITGQADEIKFPDSYFDVVFCLNSFHHYLNPDDVISEINRVLKNNGFFVLLDPFLDNYLRKGWGFFLKKIFKEEHVNYYARESIKCMLENKKFKIIKQQTFLYFTLFTVSQNIKK